MNGCFMCKLDLELLTACCFIGFFVRALWDLTFGHLGVSWVVANSISNPLFTREGFFGKKARKKNAILLPRDFVKHLT